MRKEPVYAPDTFYKGKGSIRCISRGHDFGIQQDMGKIPGHEDESYAVYSVVNLMNDAGGISRRILILSEMRSYISLTANWGEKQYIRAQDPTNKGFYVEDNIRWLLSNQCKPTIYSDSHTLWVKETESKYANHWTRGLISGKT